MTVVVDASIALKWVVPEAGSPAAIALLASTELAAPGIWITEAANGLWKYVMRRELGLPDAQDLLKRLCSVPIAVSAADDDLENAFRLAAELSHPVYDCLYLALALRQDTYAVTADKRFLGLAERRSDLSGHIRALT